MSDSSGKILIADDEPLFLKTTAALLRKAGYECVSAPDGQAALEALSRQRFDLVLSDLNMPGNFKLELLHAGRDKWPEIPLIVVTGAPSLPTAIESVRLGIVDYLLKPVKYEDLLSSVRRALARRARHTPSTVAPSSRAGFPHVIGESPPMRDVFEIVDRIADTDTSVLITGETGTGKEVIAGAIHRRSHRAQHNFQTIDCTAVPDTLFESVLFGHAKGAFTGAIKDQDGLLLQADKGTAFLDEIGELPALLQSKLLRVIQEQTFVPVGRSAIVQVDTRFICATNRDLELEVNAGRFRRDLFYRIAVIHIELPPLRQRGDDVLLLAQHFLETLQRRDRRVVGLAAETEALLLRYPWPGNIRELRNAIERGLAMADSDRLLAAHLPLAIQRASAQSPPADVSTETPVASANSREDADRVYLIRLLSENSGNVASSARQARMSRQGLHKLLKKHGLNAGDYRT